MARKIEDIYNIEGEYRDTIATVNQKGERIWIYPRKPSGFFHRWRIVVAIVLLAAFFIGPFIKINGVPFMLINVFERRFIVLGVPLWPQDFHIVALGLISLVVFIVLFTVIYGRVWCGWACPQTIFMEMVFRKIEYWIEGDAPRQKKLSDAPWNAEKVLKKSAKHLVFILISLVISHTVMAYLIGIDQVKEIVSQPPARHLAGFIGLMAFTLIFYLVFSFLREQVCVAVCPYGRLQGVLLGNNSIAVIYDWLRGEPRGKVRKAETRGDKGDCIDCRMCVYACPTGIDIRNGTQLECVNCTACMDACDAIMDRVEKPRGLIRYGSYNSIKEGHLKIFTSRVAGYTAVLLILTSAMFYMLLTRPDIEATILKVPGQLYQEQPGDRISNLYNIQFVNKTYDDAVITLSIKDLESASIKRVGDQNIVIPASGSIDGVFFIELPRSSINRMKTDLVIRLNRGDEVLDEIKTNFIGPVNRSNQ